MKHSRTELFKKQQIKQGNKKIIKKTSKHQLIREDKQYRVFNVQSGISREVDKEKILDLFELSGKEFDVKMSVFIGV